MNDLDDELVRKTLVEPFRCKVVERIHLRPRAEREALLKKAFYSFAYLDSDDVFIDLATDSGTGSMSDEQWAGLMRGDEAYIRSRSFFRFEASVQETTGYRHVIPTHQGRAAEHIIMGLLAKPDCIIPNNSHFDTTRAHVEHRGAIPLDLVGDWLWDFKDERPFKGNFDLEKLELALARYHKRIPFLIITVLNNLACSSPVSMENIRSVRLLADRYDIPVFFDACRFAENAHFIKTREAGYANHSVHDIAREMFSYGHGCWMSAKKDGLVNIGGFIATNDEALARRCQESLVLFEGFPSYGGLAGRDLEAIAIGLKEGMDHHYLAHRTRQVAYLGGLFEKLGVSVSKPVGGSGVFVDARSIYPHLSDEDLPGIALTCDMFLEGGIRAGTLPMAMNLVDAKTGDIHNRVFHLIRFAIPRRMYGKSHLDFVGEVMKRVLEKAPQNPGYKLIEAPAVLAHFFAKFAPADIGPEIRPAPTAKPVRAPSLA